MRIFLTLLILTILSQQIVKCDKFKDYNEEYKQTINDILQEKNLLEDKILGQLYSSVFIVNSQLTSDWFTSESLCSALKNINQDYLNQQQAYQFVSLLASDMHLNCQVTIKQSIVELFESTLSNQSDLKELYNSFMGLLTLNSTGKLEQGCKQLKDFIHHDGTTQSLKNNAEGASYKNTGLILQLYQYCLRSSTKYTNELKVPLNSILLNSYEIIDGQWGVLEKNDTLYSTAQITGQLYSLFQEFKTLLPQLQATFSQQYFSKFYKFLTANIPIAQSTCQKKSLVNAFKSFGNLPIVTLDSTYSVVKGDSAQFQFHFESPFGGRIEVANASQVLSVQLLRRGDVVHNAAVTVTDNQLTINTKQLEKYGFYSLAINLTHNSQQYVFQETILLNANCQVKELAFEIVKGRGTPNHYSNKVKFNQNIKEPFKLMENSFIHFQFALNCQNNINFRPQTIGVVLVHPKHGFTTTFVPAKYSELDAKWYATVDLGDPDHILAYTNSYDVQLLVGDQAMTDNIRWQFAVFQVKFKKPKQEKPPTDLDYNVAPAIAHTFPAEHQQPPIYFVLSFVGMICLSFLLFFYMISRLNVNLSRLPDDFNGLLSNLLFVVLLLIMFGILVIFWVKINLIQSLQILLITVPPFFLVGNYALSQLKK